MMTESNVATIAPNGNITGEMVIRFTDVSIGAFMSYRRRIQEIITPGIKVARSSVEISESAALVNSTKETQTAPYHKEPRHVEKKKRSYLSAPARKSLKSLLGCDQGMIVREFRRQIKTAWTDAEILRQFARVHGFVGVTVKDGVIQI
jgi:hypothetical protein